jgi:hypothetical protein
MLGLQREVHRVLIDPLPVLEESAPERGVPQIRADLLDVADSLSRCGERLVDASEPGEGAGLALVQSGEPRGTLDLASESDALLVDVEGSRPVLPREGQAPLAGEQRDLDLAEPGQARIRETTGERGIGLGGMAERQLGPAHLEEGAGGPAAHLGPEGRRRPRRQPALDAVEELRRLAAPRQRGRVVALSVGNHPEPVQEKTLGSPLPATAQPGPAELEPFLEGLPGSREVADRTIRPAQLRVHRGPRAQVRRREPARLLEHLERPVPVLDGLLEATDAKRGRRGRVPCAGRAPQITLLLGLVGCPLVVVERLSPLAPADGLDGTGPVERVLAGGQRPFLRCPLRLPVPPLAAEAALGLDRRRCHAGEHRADERSAHQHPGEGHG